MKIEYHDGEVVELGFDDRLHSYRIGKEPNLELIPSVTQNMDVISKPALIPWALSEGVNWLANHLFYDSDRDNYHTKNVGIDFITKGIKGAYRNTSTSAINIGTITHTWVEGAIRYKLEGGDPPPMPKQKEAQKAIEAFRAWVSENEVEWHSSERKLYHRTYKYAGTVDAVATVNGEYCVIDWKTSKAVYPEYYLQVAAYAKAIEDMDGVDVDSAYILRCDKKTGKFEYVQSENFELDFDAFLAAQRLRRRLKVLSKKRK